MLGQDGGGSTRFAGPDKLTPFELRILELRVSGLTRNQIAQRLGRSPQTISNSLTLAKEKLGAGSLLEAAVLLFKPNAEVRLTDTDDPRRSVDRFTAQAR